MKFRLLALSLVIALAGCATYKQLKPKPELSPAEQGYIELKNDAKNFELKKTKKYFISFPATAEDHNYIVLNLPDKKKFTSFFSATLTEKGLPGQKLADETPYPDTVSVYPVGRSGTPFYWFIENGAADVVLSMKYRYTPQWRYKFETNYAAFSNILAHNKVDRSTSKAIGTTLHFDNNFNFTLVLDTVGKHTAELDKVHKELVAIESIFPASILNSQDPAYLNYKKLRAELEEEILFQKTYTAAIDFFYNEQKSRSSTLAFLDNVEPFAAFFTSPNKQPQNILKEAQDILKRRLDEVIPFYNQRLAGKDDYKPFSQENFRVQSFNKLPALLRAADIAIPADVANLGKFLNDFDAKSKTLLVVRDSLAPIPDMIKKIPPMPENNAFAPLVTKSTELQKHLPTNVSEQYGAFAQMPCALALNKEIAQTTTDVDKLVKDLKIADALMPQLNTLKTQRDFSGMITVLKQSSQVDFLLDKFRDVDKMSIEEQAGKIKGLLETGGWQMAETALKTLHNDQNFLNPPLWIPVKNKIVWELEESLYNKVEQLTRSKINKFLEEKVDTFENVDSLYTDSVFLPAYDITFSSGGKKDLIEKKATLVADLAKIKSNEFPAKAIKLLYDKFLKSFDNNGVLMARAIVTHGNHYTADDKEIKMRVAECNPQSSKWIVKPKEYRRVFVLPVTDKPSGKNKYMVRFIVNIPTEATFPVYDVNIKLPKELCGNAATTQWYDEITLNKKPLKNEGRFTISAPGAQNDYECQITPVQMNKDANNVLEITYTANSFKVYAISVMVQKPIIKKN